jgi:hypothetical protein
MAAPALHRKLNQLAELDSRRKDWSRRTLPKHARQSKGSRDRTVFYKQLAWIGYCTLLLLFLLAAAASCFRVSLPQPILAFMLSGGAGMLVVANLRNAISSVADAARFFRTLQGQDQPSVARERRSVSAPMRAIAAIAAAAAARFRLALQAVHRVAASLRQALGAVAPTFHPRLATSLAVRSAALCVA